MEWLLQFWTDLTWSKIGLGVGLFVLSFGLSLAAIAVVMVKIPENYFSSHYQRDFLPDSFLKTFWAYF